MITLLMHHFAIKVTVRLLSASPYDEVSLLNSPLGLDQNS